MPIFQKSVINSIKQDESLVASRWNNFQNYIAKIDAIRGFKEEVYQDGFFKDIFESCLGYTLKTTNPNDYNLEREKKNETDGKKADGVIYVNGEIIGVVELKDQKTKNLDAVEGQAFNYHASHSNSKYIIISNFDELRFYIDKKTAYEKFNLFNLSYEDFRTLHLLISYESIKENIPLKLKEKSTNFEQTISKELYRDFSAFRTHLFENIIKNNDMDRSLLLRLTQKLCDRIIFILFAEDRELLKKETIKEIRTRHSADGFGDRSLYDYYKLYFNAINTGNDKLGIPKYNGGLFATDEILDTLIIDDSYLDMEAQKLSDFDFVSEISVNILGHIFEQSLTDLEEMNASINDAEFDKKKSKRKKDGVFYTPEYITRYIVENTLGKLCIDKKVELKIEAETVVVNPRKLTKAEQNYKETLIDYREWLTQLKILDPACGSGAFLNQALEFLIREHTLIRDLLLPYEDLMIGYEVEKSILENNLYGVDINEDAVEIAKLSLWLRTAHKGRELTSLNDKIVCANSLLAMPFEENSFDVVIGNPPYGADVSENNFESNETYLLFYKLSVNLLRDKGLLGFITPDSWLTNKNASFIRKLFIEKGSISSLYDAYKPFIDAPDVWCNIPIFHKNEFIESVNISRDFPYNLPLFQFQTSWNNFVLFGETEWFPYVNNALKSVFNKMNSFNKIEDYFEAKRGFSPTPNPVNLTSITTKRQVIGGEDFGRYEYKIKPKYLIDEYSKSSKQIDEIQLMDFIGIQRIRTNSLDFKSRWLVCQYFEAGYVPIDSIGYFTKKSELDCKYLLALLNSNLMNLYYKLHYTDKNVKPTYLKRLPIPHISDIEQQLLINLVNELLETKPKIKEYKALLQEAIKNDNFDREIKLKKEIETFENRVIECEKEIDVMVYVLYGLSEDEIAIVEGEQ